MRSPMSSSLLCGFQIITMDGTKAKLLQRNFNGEITNGEEASVGCYNHGGNCQKFVNKVGFSAFGENLNHQKGGLILLYFMIMEPLCIAFCGEPNYGGIESILIPSSCLNNIFIILVDIILLFMFFLYFIIKQSPRTSQLPSRFQRFSSLQIYSSIFNCGLGLIYLGFGIWILEEKIRNEYVLLPLHLWVVMLFHGLTWFLMGLTLSLRERLVQESFVKIWSIFATLYAGFLSASSLLVVFVKKEVSVNVVLNVLSLPGAVLLLFCTIKGKRNIGTSLYVPLNNEANTSTSIDPDYNVSPFANAGLLSRTLFWWLNPLLKKGKEKILDDQDIPGLCEDHRAETCYLLFNQKLNIQKEKKPSTPASVLWTLTSTHLKEIMISGCFALLKTLALSSGPLFLNAFIDVSEGKKSFRYEGYTLCGGLFLVKISESLFQNQWYFRSEIVGLQVRSALLAVIYKKQLRLSNSAKAAHSSGEIMSYVTVDAYKIGGFPIWFHRIWTTILQISIALVILVNALGLATMAALLAITLSVLCNTPLGKLQHKYLTQLLMAQDKRLKATTEALINMKVLKLYAWETHFKKVIENLRKDENKWLWSIQKLKSYLTFLFLASPTVVSVVTFLACYLLGVPLSARNVFTFVATLRLVQEPIREVPDVIEAVIQAKVSLERIVKFLNAPELQSGHIKRKCKEEFKHSIFMKSANFSWDESSSKTSLRNINFEAKPSEKIAICGEVGSGKSTLLAAILGEVPIIDGTIQVYGKIAYVSQTSWIQSGTIQENILFGSRMDKKRYEEAVEKCSLVKDLEMLVFGDLTEIGERGINLSGGQKQRIQLARALYQDADLYLLDDPFSAVDAHTAKCLFNDYVLGALSKKTVLLVTHQVDFLPAFDSILLMSDGKILHISPYHHLLVSSQEFQDLVNAQKGIIGSENVKNVASAERLGKSRREKKNETFTERELKALVGNQLIKQEEKEVGDTGLKPYKQYLNQKNSCLYFSFACLCHLIFTLSQILQNFWMADNVENSDVGRLRLVLVYLVIATFSTIFLLLRSLSIRSLCFQSSKSFFSQLLNSLFRAPMFFYDSTPLGRILVRVSSDLSVVDLDVPFKFLIAVSATVNTFANLGVLVFLTWQVLIIAIPMVYLTIRLQRYYFASSKELMRINGTTKSLVVNHLAESIAGAMTIRAFEGQERFFTKSLELINKNATPLFHNFAANEWLILRLEIVSAIVLGFSALAIVLNPPGTFGSGFVGMALSSGLSLNMFLVYSIQFQCALANDIISVERLNQYMYLPSEAPKIIEGNRPTTSWPGFGKVEIQDLKIRYRPNTPFVLHGISCTFQGGQNIGIVGRTGSGKTTLIGALFRLVEPSGGKIVIDGIDIAAIGLHDLRSRLSIIPQEPILFQGTVRYNLDPLEEYTDQEIWKVLEKCQLQEVVQEKQQGLDYHVAEDGSNWSMGQRQLFCLGRALLRRSRILVLDEATASIDNTTDLILQKTVRAEFEDCTVITVAHRIPTVIDCNMVLSISDGKLVEYDDPMKLMKREGSLFGQLVREYWSQTAHTTMLP